MSGDLLALGAVAALAGAGALSQRRGSRNRRLWTPTYASWVTAWETWKKEGGRLEDIDDPEILVQMDWCLTEGTADLTQGSPWAHKFNAADRAPTGRFGVPALGDPALGFCPPPPGWIWPKWAWHDGPQVIRRMYARVKKDPLRGASRVFGGHGRQFEHALRAIAGHTVPVETEFLFRDQFNSSVGLRLMARHVDAVFNDARLSGNQVKIPGAAWAAGATTVVGRGRCTWCGNVVPEVLRGCALCERRGGESAREARERGVDAFVWPRGTRRRRRTLRIDGRKQRGLYRSPMTPRSFALAVRNVKIK